MNLSRATASSRIAIALRWIVLFWFSFVCGCGTSSRGQLAACSGGYAGTFTGAGGGTVTGSLGAGGSLDLTFTLTNATIPNVTGFSYHVTGIAGDFTGTNPDDVSGSFDLGSCRISGIWTFQGRSGTWFVTFQRQ